MPKNMPTEEHSRKRPAPRTCKRCGQAINTQTDSWEMKHSDDGDYAVGIQHVTCPPSPELQALPTLEPAPAAPDAPKGESASDSPEYLTMDEAAQLIRVSKGTIRNRIKSGDLPAKRLRGGQTVLVLKPDVLALLDDITPGTDV